MKHNTFTDSSRFCLVVLPVLLVLQDVSSGRPVLRRTLEGILPWQRTGPHQLPLQPEVHKLFIDTHKHSLSLSLAALQPNRTDIPHLLSHLENSAVTANTHTHTVTLESGVGWGGARWKGFCFVFLLQTERLGDQPKAGEWNYRIVTCSSRYNSGHQPMLRECVRGYQASQWTRLSRVWSNHL